MKAYCSLGCEANWWKKVTTLQSTGEAASVSANITDGRAPHKKEKPTLEQVQSRATKHILEVGTSDVRG